jgi:hypothetical protein
LNRQRLKQYRKSCVIQSVTTIPDRRAWFWVIRLLLYGLIFLSIGFAAQFSPLNFHRSIFDAGDRDFQAGDREGRFGAAGQIDKSCKGSSRTTPTLGRHIQDSYLPAMPCGFYRGMRCEVGGYQRLYSRIISPGFDCVTTPLGGMGKG